MIFDKNEDLVDICMYKPRLAASCYKFPCTRRPKGGMDNVFKAVFTKNNPMFKTVLSRLVSAIVGGDERPEVAGGVFPVS